MKRKRKNRRGIHQLKAFENMDLSFMSVSTGKIKKQVHGIEWHYRVPTAREDDEFQSIQLRMMTDGKPLAEAFNQRGSSKKEDPNKIINFSELALRRFQLLVTGWEPAFTVNEKELAYSRENVALIVEDLPKLAQQVDSALWAAYTEFTEEEAGN